MVEKRVVRVEKGKDGVRMVVGWWRSVVVVGEVRLDSLEVVEVEVCMDEGVMVEWVKVGGRLGEDVVMVEGGD